MTLKTTTQHHPANQRRSTDQLHDAAYDHLVAKTLWHKRNILLRVALNRASLISKDLNAVVATSRAKLRDQKDGISPVTFLRFRKSNGWRNH